jgi:hypothetical protein
MSRVAAVPSNKISPNSLSQAVDASERIKDRVEECATELSVVNTVLKEQLDRPTAPDEVARAIEKSEAVEAKVQDSADELTKVNEALVEEVRERRLLEHQLETSKAQEHASRHAALHDPLTSLPNRDTLRRSSGARSRASKAARLDHRGHVHRLGCLQGHQ